VAELNQPLFSLNNESSMIPVGGFLAANLNAQSPRGFN